MATVGCGCDDYCVLQSTLKRRSHFLFGRSFSFPLGDIIRCHYECIGHVNDGHLIL